MKGTPQLQSRPRPTGLVLDIVTKEQTKDTQVALTPNEPARRKLKIHHEGMGLAAPQGGEAQLTEGSDQKHSRQGRAKNALTADSGS